MSSIFDGRGSRRRWGGLFSGGERRRAIEAEAGGDYTEAARAYAAAGDRTKVAEMHLLDSERAPDPDAKLASLREGVGWLDEEGEDTTRVRRRIANAMLAWVKGRGLVTDGDRAVVGEAAALFRAAGDAAGAGACHELLGAASAAADAYQSAGEVEQLERLLDTEVDRRRRAVALSDAIEEHRMRLRAGDAVGALAALAAGLEAADARDRTTLQRMQDELLARRLPRGRIELRADRTRVLVAEPPITIGRELACSLPLRDGGVSRHHAELVREGEAWTLVDLGSKNGTTLGSIAVAGSLPLPAEGELGFGDRCAARCLTGPDQLSLELTRGLDRGLRLYAPIPGGSVRLTASAGATPLLALRFVDGRVRVRALEGRNLRLNASAVSGEIEPLAGDVLELGDARWQVPA